MSPTQTQLSVGVTVQLSASVRDANGRAVAGVSVSWQSLVPTVADVVNGVVTGRAAGQTRVVAAGSAMADPAIVVVMPGAAGADSLSLASDALTLRPGTTGQLSATPRGAAGAPMPWRYSIREPILALGGRPVRRTRNSIGIGWR